MPADPSGEPWPGATYNGFSGPNPPAERPPRRWGRLLAIGAGAALVLGVGFGLLVRPDIKTPESAASASAAAVPIEVTRPPPQAAPEPAGKIEVLPPEIAAQARAQAQAAQPPPSDVLPEVDTPAAAEPTPAPSVQPAPLPVAPPPRYAARDEGACAGAGGPAEQMICADPGLAAADRALSRAYRQALAAGADPRQLRAEQRDFMAIREDAASRSRRALASVMAQRTEELNAMAEDARRDDGDGYGDDEGPGWR